MNIQSISTKYDIRKIADVDIPTVLKLCKSNHQYYQYCPPAVSIEEIRSDMIALPPGKTYTDKYYIGFFESEKLVAVMDLIFEYPDSETCFIGFFMVDHNLQGRSVGSSIITECLQALKRFGFLKVRLGYVKGNPQPKAFWEKNQFKPTGAESIQEHYTVIVMEKEL